MDETDQRQANNYYRDQRNYGPPVPQVSPQREVNANAGMQIALTVLALAALPISAWLYIASYVEDRVESAVAAQEKAAMTSFDLQANDIENLRDYALNLCIGVRKIDPTFSCGSSYSSRAAYRSQQNR